MLKTKSTSAIFNHLLTVISGERFLRKEGLGNEIPFFICPYAPENSVEMEQSREKLVVQLNQRRVRVLEVNLYDLSLGILKNRDILDQILVIEYLYLRMNLRNSYRGYSTMKTT